MAWRDHVKYPAAEGSGSLSGVELMDILDTLIPIEEAVEKAFIKDRTGIFGHWLRMADEAGLIPRASNDDCQIRRELIHGCGGL